MDNIIYDLEPLYDYFINNFQKSGIQIIKKPDNKNFEKTLIDKVETWFKNLNKEEKTQLINLINTTYQNFDIKNTALNRDNTYKQWRLWIIQGILFVIIGFYFTIRYNIWSNSPSNTRERFINFLSYNLVILCIYLLLSNYISNQQKKNSNQKNKLSSFTNSIHIILNKLKRNVNPATGVRGAKAVELKNWQSPGTSITDFVYNYENEVSKLKFGSFLRFSLLDKIQFFFSEQKNIIYKNSNNSLSNLEYTENFVNFLIDNKKIVEELRIIKDINKDNDLFKDIEQTEIVNSFYDELIFKDTLTDKDKITENLVYKIIKSKLKLIILYYNITESQILNQITKKINEINTSKNPEFNDPHYKNFIENPEIIYDNYSFLIELLYSEIDNDTKNNNYMSTKEAIPSRFVISGNFIDFYKNLSLSQLNLVKQSTNITINDINKFLNDYKDDIEKEFDDKKQRNDQIFYISVTIILITGLQIWRYVYNDSEEYRLSIKTNAYKPKTSSNVDEGINLVNKGGDILMNFANYYSIWFFFVTVILTYWYRQKISNLVNLSQYKLNTDNIKLKLSEISSKLQDLINLRKYMNKTIKLEIIKPILSNKYNYEVIEDSSKINRIKKRDNIFTTISDVDVEKDIIYSIYLDFVDMMKIYENQNFINIITDIPYPTTEIILTCVFLAISMLVIFLILQRLNPIELLTDVQNLRKCNNDGKIELQKILFDTKVKLKKYSQSGLILNASDMKNKSDLEVLQKDLIYQIKKMPDSICEELINKYQTKDLSRAKLIMTISIVYTTIFLSYKILASTFAYS